MDRELASGRYLLEEPIGSGSMGIVYRAEDRVLGREVALKTFARPSPEELYRLKQEFRVLADLLHPNLVELYELHVSQSPPEAFFTMELLDGKDLLEHVHGADRNLLEEPLTEEGIGRLRSALTQLVAGLEFLHGAGRLHRDIKPSNLLVCSTGRLVLLDFGLSSLKRALTGSSSSDGVFGTLPYMSPEQAWGERLTPRSDWYSVGVVLYKALTGILPFSEEITELLEEKRTRSPAPPSSLVGPVPDDLDRLSVALLQPRPEDRPDPADIGSWLGVERRDPALTPSTSAVFEAPFVAREGEIAFVRDALATVARGSPVTLHVEGPSGIGKTALLRHVLSQVREEANVVVLAGRCHPQEAVPFKSLDGVVDALSRFLRNLPEAEAAEVVPESTGALLRLFPVLGRVRAVSRRAGREPQPEPRELRRLAFETLRDLLRTLGRRATVVLWIDDVQWGDLDSAGFLHELAEGPERPAIALVFSYRSEDLDVSPLLRSLRSGHSQGSVLRVGPLGTEAARELARTVIAGHGDIDEEHLDVIVREAVGSPFVACELARYWSGRKEPAQLSGFALGHIIRERIEQLGDAAARLLEVVAVANGPCPRAVAVEAAGVGAAFGAAASGLRSQCLLRHSEGPEDVSLETYHDQIREAVLESLDENRRRDVHASLARAFEADPKTDPMRLVEHYQGAGDAEGAGRAAARAAGRALEALAFDQAARLFSLALELRPGDPESWQWWRGRGDALAQAGRGAEAAPCLARAAAELQRREPESSELPRLNRLVAEQYLRSGYVDEGLDGLRAVLRASGEKFPKSTYRTLIAIVVERLRLAARGLRYRVRPESLVSARRLAEIDACWAASVGLVWIDPIRSAVFHARHVRKSLDSGEPARVVRALCTEAAYQAAFGGGAARRRALRALEAAERLQSTLDDPVAEGLTAVCAAGYSYFSGLFQDGFLQSQRAEEILRTRCTGVAWERTNAHIFGMWSLAHMGAIQRLRETVPGILYAARDRGDLLASASLAAGIPTSLRCLADDRPGEAREQVAEALQSWRGTGFHLPHYYGTVSETLTDLYTGDPARAWRRILAAWAALKNRRLLDFQLVRVELTGLRARCALAAAVAGAPPAVLEGWSRNGLLREVARTARRIGREDQPGAAPLAATLQAGLAAIEGRDAGAVAALESAVEAFDAASMILPAAATRIRLGTLRGDAEGERHRAEGYAAMEREGVARPDRLAATFVPLTGR